MNRPTPKRPLFLAPVLAALMIGALAAGPAFSEAFKRLSAREIREQLVGRQVTDDVHWFDRYNNDGSIVRIDLGKATPGHWHISGDLLCVDGPTAGCYEIWVSGADVQFRVDGKEFMPMTGLLRPQR